MKRESRLLLLLGLLAALAGYLLSKASLAGRVGISLFYKQYAFLKVWWQAGLLVLFIWVLLFLLQKWATRKLPSTTSTWIHVGAIAVAIAGLYFTYDDFRHNLSHRWLGERFHLGGYLFWIGWLLISVFYLTSKRITRSPNDLASNRDVHSTTRRSNL